MQGLQPGSESTGVATRAVVAAPSASSDIEARQATPDVHRARKTVILAIVAATLLAAWLFSPDSRYDFARRSCGRSRCSPSRCKPRRCTRIWERAGGGDWQATRSPANAHRQTVAAWRHRRSARTQSRARGGRTTERGRHANGAAACDRAAYCVHRRRARALGRCRRSTRQRSDVAGIADRPAGRNGARRSDERERARGARPPHDGEPRRVSVVPAGTVALRAADEPRFARRGRGFERATASDSSYALAYAWLANTYTPLSYLGFAPPWETEPAQRAAGEKRSCSTAVWPRRTSVSRWSWPTTSGAGPRRGGVSPRTRARSQLRHRSPLVCVLPHDRRTIRRAAGRATTCSKSTR